MQSTIIIDLFVFCTELLNICIFTFDNSSELGWKTGKCAREDKEVSVLESKLGELYLATELYSASLSQAQLPNPAVGPARWRGKHKQ